NVLCSLYFELRQVGIITAAPTFNATFEATVKEIENTSFNLWLKSRREATSLVDSTGKELKWLPRLTELNREERNTKIGELLANVTETIEEVGPNKQTVSFLGTTIPGILIIIATPVTLLFLQYYFSNHLSHLANSKISDRDSFPQFAWMPMSLRSRASTLELLWTIAFLPIATLIVLWVQVAKFEALDWFPSIIIIAAILGISAFSWKSHKCLKKLRTSIESVSAQVQESQSKVAIEKLDHVALDVMDVDKAASFYGVLLGLKEIARPESFDFPGLWYELGNTVLHIVGPRQPSLGAHHIAFWVNDVHACAETVREAGFQVEWDPYKIVGVDRFFTADPEGNRIEIQGTERNLEAYTGP
ncbi:MAG: VOC family protein, partial [Verrucomicrobiota bacterium]